MTAAATASDARSRLRQALSDAGGDLGDEVLIAGGGIAGLALALALSQRGIPSHILERRRAFSEEGAGIQIGPNGTRVLMELGIAETLRPHAGVPDWLVVHDAAHGNELTRLPLNARMPGKFGSPYWTVHREDLHATLLTQVRAKSGIRVTQDAEVMCAASGPGAAGVSTHDGRTFIAMAVIGADGLRSGMRNDVSGPAPLIPTGKSAFRSVVERAALPAALADGSTHIWLAPDAHVVHYPVRGGREVAVVVIASSSFSGEGWSHEAQVGSALTNVTLASPLAELLRSAPSWRQWALIAPEHEIASVTGRLALVGDAAHPTLPFLAQGGVMALEDSVVLAEVMAAHRDDIPEALQQYRRLRETRVRRVAEASRRNGRIYHYGGLMRAARNAAFRIVPGDRLISTYDWLYGWRR